MPGDSEEIASWVQPEAILLDVEARDQDHALELISQAVAHAHGLDPGPIFRALERREQAASTALGDGFAIPHARIGGLAKPSTLFLRTKNGIAFHAPDGKRVRDLLAIMVPTDGDKTDHLRLLAVIARLFSDRTFRAALDSAPDADSAASVFRRGVLRLGGRAEGGVEPPPRARSPGARES